MDIWNMPHVEDGDKYYIRKEYAEISQLGKSNEPPLVTQPPIPPAEPASTEPVGQAEPTQGKQEEGV
jgi:hypothetical protein